ncbi:hypothetical protein TCAL_05860 [Tigriopus californicus]|uniref:sn-1-specific diacylglycerol lipase n=1 Tax=Tigriopus californicus TaxID=6832 RepID=A0A553NQF6_TIGCA|nr:diacylglycerol lipase-beta-like [Tigriopus californicus]TRY67654.1 hypothetical protein TCAL_05860 [Tigriopus californicus]|eukprot:TCALIF_05860-PA protein Name:"Similar to DAGLB Sn1-specific diacylglycerol lipase beta (Homo sapiens)" AED:0.15 eAED:0.15 QI:0/-1/0/1/-1/1/1/0/733
MFRLTNRFHEGNAGPSLRSPPDFHTPGGGLRLCGCLWRTASDDLVIPAVMEFCTRTVGLLILVGVLVYTEVSQLSCASEHHLNVYLMVAIGLFAANILNNLALAVDSAQGRIWDEDPRVRRWVVPLIYLNVCMTMGEFGWALVGTFWVARGLLSQCQPNPQSLDITDVPLYAILAIIIFIWLGLVFKVVVVVISFNSIEWKNHRSRANNNESFVMEQPQSCLSRIFSLCVGKSQIDCFKEIANVLSFVFDQENFVPTDIAAALLLIYVKQNECRVVVGGDPIAPTSAKYRSPASSASTHPPSSPSRLPSDPVILDSQGAHEDHLKAWEEPELVKHFMFYAGASYGYTWYLMKNTSINMCNIYARMRCCACFSCVSPEDFIQGDNCLQCNTAALMSMLPHLDQEALVHISFKNNFLEVPFFVAVDQRYRKIVISIRGTLSLEDALTDLCATPSEMTAFDPDLKGFQAHNGILSAAKYVYDQLVEKHVLDKAFSYYDDYQLVVTGHSLGAGTAVILAFMLRRFYPNTKCYAFSPPGGLLNEMAAKASEHFTISVVVGMDLIPRLSLQSLTLLKEQMKSELTQCTLPKYQILRGLCGCCIKDWHAPIAEAHRQNSESSDIREPILESSRRLHVEGGQYESFNEVAESSPAHQASPSSNQDAERRKSLPHVKLVLPGKIWHVEQSSENSENWRVSLKTAQDFQNILVHPKMLSDHFPNNVTEILASLNLSFDFPIAC